MKQEIFEKNLPALDLTKNIKKQISIISKFRNIFILNKSFYIIIKYNHLLNEICINIDHLKQKSIKTIIIFTCLIIII